MTIAPDLDITHLDFPTRELPTEPEVPYFEQVDFEPPQYSDIALAKAQQVIAAQRAAAAAEVKASRYFADSMANLRKAVESIVTTIGSIPPADLTAFYTDLIAARNALDMATARGEDTYCWCSPSRDMVLRRYQAISTVNAHRKRYQATEREHRKFEREFNA